MFKTWEKIITNKQTCLNCVLNHNFETDKNLFTHKAMSLWEHLYSNYIHVIGKFFDFNYCIQSDIPKQTTNVRM